MSWIKRAASLYRFLFHRDSVEEELGAEVGAYFETLIDRYMEQGMSREEAFRAARLRFEGPEQVKERVRESRFGAPLEATLKDFRYAARMLRKNPGFAAVAICSLAIGIGATSAIYSIADALLLRPLPVPDAGGVVALNPVTDQVLAGLNAVSYPDYTEFRDRNRTFAGLLAQAYSSFGLAPDRTTLPRVKFGMFVSGNFFQLLGVSPSLGRAFRPEEDQVAGRDAVVVLSHELWVSNYESRPSVVGERLWLNGIEFTIVGVAPDSFTGTDQFMRPALYVPLAMQPRLTGANNLDRRQVRWLTLKGRLGPGIGIPQAQADISAIVASLQNTYSEIDGNLHIKVETQLQYQTAYAPPRTTFIAMLGLLSICVLIVACANVAGLLLSRSGVRAREIGVRLAIGAGRVSLIRQLLIENSLLAIGGGALGLGIAYTAVRVWNSIPLPSDLPFNFAIKLDGRSLLFTAGVSILSTFVFGLAPALRTTRLDLVGALKAGGAVTSGTTRLWGRQTLVAAQVALSLLLLIVSAVLVAGFRADLLRGPGFRLDSLFLMSMDTSLVRYTDQQRDRFFKQLLDTARMAPDVGSAVLTSSVPLSLGAAPTAVVPEGYALPRGQEAISVFHSVVSDGYFQTMAIPIIGGRGFLESDQANTRAVAVVNEEFASHYWPNRSPLGRRFHLRNATGKLVEIVGVARTTRYLSISESPIDFVYLPFSQNPQSQMTLVAEAKSADPSVLAPVLRHVTQSLDGNMPVFDMRSMQDVYTFRAVMGPNLLSKTVVGLGIMGLILAVIGLYGLVAYSVSRRSREFGIRMAIGADRSSIARMVLKQGFVIGIAGITVGLVLGFFASQGLKSGLFGVGDSGVLPYAAVSLLLLATSMAATWFPARRASRIDPLRALRDE